MYTARTPFFVGALDQATVGITNVVGGIAEGCARESEEQREGQAADRHLGHISFPFAHCTPGCVISDSMKCDNSAMNRPR